MADNTLPFWDRLRPVLITALIVAALLLACHLSATRSTDYDEAWTLTHYARAHDTDQLFSTFNLPNNHPLYSAAVKGLDSLGLAEPWSLRLPALLSGLLALGLLFDVLRRWLGPGPGALAWTLGLGLGPTLAFACQGRGYAFQTLGLVLTAGGLWAWGRWGPALAGIGAALAAVTLPTSALYLLFLVAAWLHLGTGSFEKRCQRLWGVAIAGGTAGLWLFRHRQDIFSGAESLGYTPLSPADLPGFIASTSSALVTAPLAIIAAVACALQWRSSQVRWLALSVLALLAGTLVIPAGPTRVYQPLSWCLIILVVLGVRGLRLAHTSRQVLIIAGIAVSGWLMPQRLQAFLPADLWQQARGLLDTSPEGATIIWPPTTGYVLQHNGGAPLLSTLLRRLPGNDGGLLIQDGPADRITGLHARSGANADIPLPPALTGQPSPVDDRSVAVWGLIPEPEATSPILIVRVGPCSAQDFTTWAQRLVHETGISWVFLNNWLSTSLTDPGTGAHYRGALFAAHNTEDSRVLRDLIAQGFPLIQAYHLAPRP